MKQERRFPYVKVTGKQEKSVKKGHPWIYEDEITECTDPIENGSFTDVYGQKGNWLGTGFYSSASKIRVRILSDNANETFADSFFERRVQYALQYRFDTMKKDLNALRLIHGEADGLPGLTMDFYNGVIVTECASYGTEQHKDVIYQAAVNFLKDKGVNVRGIYERNELELRNKEGLDTYQGWYEGIPHEDLTHVEIDECGLRYDVDFINGQKTGFFLDQKYNRLCVRRTAEGRSVLDCCTHTGSFAINAAYGGAKNVTALDISETAIEEAKLNASLNGLGDKITFETGDVFEKLESLKNSKESYDFIILDPPAFTKSRKTFRSARAGYLNINTMAMRVLPRGGYLVTCSCSHFMPVEEFRQMLLEAGRASGRSVRIAEERYASPDHPELLGVPETSYLKFFLLQVI